MTEIFRYMDPDKGDMEMVEVEGLKVHADGVKMFLNDKSLKEHVEDLKNLTVRHDDIYVCAYAKCGKYIFYC